MFSWGGISEAAIQQGDSALGKMANDNIKLSPCFNLHEDFSSGIVPRFNDNGEVSSENLLVDKLNQEITDIRERANAVIELRDALHALDEDSSNLTLEVLTSKRDRLSAAIDCAKLSAIDVSNEIDMEQTINQIKSEEGIPDVLIHNAVRGSRGNFLEIKTKDLLKENQ